MQRPARCEHTQIRRLRPDTWKLCREDTLIARHAIVLLIPPARPPPPLHTEAVCWAHWSY